MGRSQAPGAYDRLLVECGSLVHLESKLVASEQHRKALVIHQQASLSAYQAANTRYQDLEARLDQNRAKLLLIADLKRLRDLLSDDGVPLQFIKHKFELLAKHTQAGLVQMGADFFIRIDKGHIETLGPEFFQKIR